MRALSFVKVVIQQLNGKLNWKLELKKQETEQADYV